MIGTLFKAKQDRLPNILEHASGDKRFKILEAHMKKHQFKHDALIEVLHKAQELFGYLEDDLLLFIACKLKLPATARASPIRSAAAWLPAACPPIQRESRRLWRAP
jgi:hypothetical protein